MKQKKILSLAGIALCALLTISARNTPPPVAEYELKWSWPPVISGKQDAAAADVAAQAEVIETDMPADDLAELPQPSPLRPAPILPEAVPLPAWLKNAVAVPARGMRHELAKNGSAATLPSPVLIAIVIDDMGLGSSYNDDVLNLPAPLTLSYLPYGENLPQQTAAAHDKGHELMVHMPMQPDSHATDPGPAALRAGQKHDEMLKNLRRNLEQFDGYVGINNHMGSLLSRDSDAMKLVMAELKTRGLLYVDSRTTPESLGEKTAEDYGVPTAARDVFLDHEETPEFVAAALLRLEREALKNGSAIAIGHPKGVTVAALRDWLPKAQKKGFRIVPVTEIIKQRQFEKNAPQLVVANNAELR
ncbi:MAG: divergent polysaccharide deacetylase family protein [Pseudomonadota bacterium]|nr:divergent polysaccharide deacetylase family protein [Pseudomonadota bacterium]QKK04860.1 MAG: divergent polysaccharide deacetylase family protein [Pseudomonadota bacterium]